jgi:DNA repair exonuclease SbcCD ATPase subunit
MCKQHINDLLSIDDSNTFLCPFCDKQNSNQNIVVSKTIQYLLDMEAHKFTIDPKYERVLNNFKTEIKNLEQILNEPENFIYEEINELKRQVDLDREKTKAEIDKLADDLIDQLETFEKQFKKEYKSKVNLKHYSSQAETSKQQLKEYEKYLSLLSSNSEERDKQSKQSEITINNLKSKIMELKGNLFSNVSITYKPMENKIQDSFSKLVIKVKKNFMKMNSS